LSCPFVLLFFGASIRLTATMVILSKRIQSGSNCTCSSTCSCNKSNSRTGHTFFFWMGTTELEYFFYAFFSICLVFRFVNNKKWASFSKSIDILYGILLIIKSPNNGMVYGFTTTSGKTTLCQY
jgi:hypothetical protein